MTGTDWQAMIEALAMRNDDPCAKVGHACRCTTPEIERLIERARAQREREWRDFRSLFGLTS